MSFFDLIMCLTGLEGFGERVVTSYVCVRECLYVCGMFLCVVCTIFVDEF